MNVRDEPLLFLRQTDDMVPYRACTSEHEVVPYRACTAEHVYHVKESLSTPSRLAVTEHEVALRKEARHSDVMEY